jgi:hypothetical protein
MSGVFAPPVSQRAEALLVRAHEFRVDDQVVADVMPRSAQGDGRGPCSVRQRGAKKTMVSRFVSWLLMSNDAGDSGSGPGEP